MESEPSLPEQDVRFARLGEAALRLMAEMVSPAVLRDLQARLDAAEQYPWEEITTELNRPPVDPSELFNRALLAQRDWVVRGGPAPAARAVSPVVKAPAPRPGPERASPSAKAVSRSAPAAGSRAPRPPRSFGYHVKKLIAVLIVRGGFYGIAVLALLIAMVVVERRWPEWNLYEVARGLQEWFQGLIG